MPDKKFIARNVQFGVALEILRPVLGKAPGDDGKYEGRRA